MQTCKDIKICQPGFFFKRLSKLWIPQHGLFPLNKPKTTPSLALPGGLTRTMAGLRARLPELGGPSHIRSMLLKPTAHSYLWLKRPVTRSPDPLLSPLIGQRHRGPYKTTAASAAAANNDDDDDDSNPLKTRLESFIRCIIAFWYEINSYYTVTNLVSDSRWEVVICPLPFHTSFQKTA